MPITLSPQPVTANTVLQPADVQAIVAALSPVITLPGTETWTDLTSLNITIQPNGSGVLNARFSK